MEFHSGALLETHDLVGYQSQGQDRGLTLHYRSTWADPREIIHFGYTNVGSSFIDVRMTSAAKVIGDGFEYVLPGYEQGQGGLSNVHFFDVPPNEDEARGALLADLVDFPSGRYKFEVTSFISRPTGQVTGSAATMFDQIVVVNETESAFGAGWTLGGQQKLIEHFDGSVVLLDGDGSELLYSTETRFGELQNPPGDYSKMERLGGGRYRRTMPDQTVYTFTRAQRAFRGSLLQTVEDRNGNITTYEYDANDNLTLIRDPVGLETTFGYANGKVTSITGPAGRTTQLTYNIVGDLTRITDPDGTTRTFQYDGRHHMVAETDQRGNREEIFYGFAGRVEKTVRKDGSVQLFGPLQTQGLHPRRDTTDPDSGAPALTTGFDTASYVDGNGNLTVFRLDQQGQLLSGEDALGPLPTTERDINNQVVRSANGRGDFTRFEYDDRGNLVATWDSITEGRRTLFDGPAFSTGEESTHVHADDFNSDGHLDVATANWSAGTVSVLLGNGNGTLQDQTEYTVGLRPRRVISGDINGDQVPDLVSANALSDNVSVLLGNGDGTFADAIQVPAGNDPHSVGLGDFNRDSYLDIVTGNRSSHDVTIMLGNGNGTFSAPESFPTGNIYVQELAVADFDGDQNLDVVISQLGPATVLYGNGAGSFSEPAPTESTAAYVSVGDVDVDGDTDLLLGFGAFREAWLGRNDGDGEFTLEKVADFGGARLVRSADLNFDGLPDFVGIAGSFSDSLVHVVLSRRDGSYRAGVDYVLAGGAEDIELGDFDEDGDVDVVVANNSRSSNVVILANDGDGGFHARVNLAPADNPDFVRLVDLNMDNHLDIVMTQEFNMRYQLGNGDGTFGEPKYAGGSWGARDIVSGDMNNDGYVDVVTANSYSSVGNLDVYLGDGNGNLSDAVITEVGPLTGTNSVSLAHFNNDGILDVVIPLTRTPTSGSNNGTEVHVRLGNGDGTFGAPLVLASDLSPVDVVVGMFNGDSAYDIATANLTGDNVSVFLGNGNGTFGGAVDYDSGDGARAIATDDFNGDGNADLAVTNISEDTLSLFFGNGSGGFTKQTITAGHGADTVIARDVDRDGSIDLLLSNFNSHTVSVLLGDGSGAFPEEMEFGASRDTTGVDAGDINNDGIVDIVSVGFSGRASVHLGTDGGVDGPGKTLLTYDETFNRLTSIVNELGQTTLFELDPNSGNQLTETQLGRGPSGEEIQITLATTYTPQGQVDVITDPLGRRIDHDYDELGRPIAVTFAVGTASEASQRFEYDAAGNVTAFIDELGARTELQYDLMNRVIRVETPDPDGTGPAQSAITQLERDQVGNIIGIEDALGQSKTTVFDAMNRPIRVTDPTGAVLSLTYDANGNVSTSTDSLGNATLFEYDARNQLRSTTFANGSTQEFSYDADGNLTEVVDENGNSKRSKYDARDRLTQTLDANRGVTTTRYDLLDNVISQADELGRITRMQYDDFGRLTAIVDPGSSTASSITTRFEYDDAGNRTRLIDPAGNNTDYLYDARNRLIEITDSDPDGGTDRPTTKFTFDLKGQVTSITDPTGRESSAVYDRMGRVIRELGPDPDGDGPKTRPVTQYRYDVLGNQTAIVNRNGELTSFEYDPAGRVTRQFLPDPDGSGPLSAPILAYTYDTEGRLVASTDGEERETRFTYDAVGQLIERLSPDPDGEGVQQGDNAVFEYDGVGNLLTETNSLDVSTHYSYDELNRLISTTDGKGATTLYSYDAAGNLTTLTDPLGNTTSWQYDSLDRVISERDTLGGTRAYTYDDLGNLINSIDRNGRHINYTYDTLNRLTEEEWIDGGQVSRTLTVSYDSLGRFLTAGDSAATYSYQYDGQGRIATTSTTWPALNGTLEATNDYDAADNRTALTLSVKGDEALTNTYQYDALDRLVSVTQDLSAGSSKDVTLAYDKSNLITQITRESTGGSVATTAYEYDRAGRLMMLAHSAGASSLASYQYTYDPIGRVESVDSLVDGQSQFSYDAIGQILAATQPGASSESFAYDANGNPVDNGFTIDTNNRLSQKGTVSYAYDGEGNRTRETDSSTGKVREYRWDHRNRLVEIVRRQGAGGSVEWRVEYEYDIFNRRVEKRVDLDGDGAGGAIVERYVHDGDNMVVTMSPSGAPIEWYLNGNNVDQVFASESVDRDESWFLGDHLGSVRDVVDKNGVLKNHITYDSFGQIVSETDPTETPRFAFTGRELDEETGLAYYRSRYYDSEAHRFISEDTIGFAGRDANLNRYVGNSPTNFVDPFGEFLDFFGQVLKKVADRGAASRPQAQPNSAPTPEPEPPSPPVDNVKPKFQQTPADKTPLGRAPASGWGRINQVLGQAADGVIQKRNFDGIAKDLRDKGYDVRVPTPVELEQLMQFNGGEESSRIARQLVENRFQLIAQASNITLTIRIVDAITKAPNRSFAENCRTAADLSLVTLTVVQPGSSFVTSSQEIQRTRSVLRSTRPLRDFITGVRGETVQTLTRLPGTETITRTFQVARDTDFIAFVANLLDTVNSGQAALFSNIEKKD